jgi:FAD:protein FMN transferase
VGAAGKEITVNHPAIHVFNHRAMATTFQVRIAGEDSAYAAQAARAVFDTADRLEDLLSRFRENSEITQIAQLSPGETLRLSEPVFACLEIAREMEQATQGAFSVTPASLRSQPAIPQWSLARDGRAIRCDQARLEFDLGAIGKGFALDRMAEELFEWDCPSFLLVAGGSSVLAGNPPAGAEGWSSGLGDDNAPLRYWLAQCSLSGSGTGVKGSHIFDPRSGAPAQGRARAWALATTAAVSDALSTACMVLTEKEISEIMANRNDWLVWLNDGGEWRRYGRRNPPTIAIS